MVEQESKTAITANGEREIRMEREFDAPRERVFAVYTDPELIPQWWGWSESTTKVDYMEPRTGGRWRFVHVEDDGSENGFQGAYREVTAPERVVQTFEWEGMAGHVCVETTTFEDIGDGRTKVTTVSLFHTTEERDGMLGSMGGGAEHTYARLDELLAKQG